MLKKCKQILTNNKCIFLFINFDCSSFDFELPLLRSRGVKVKSYLCTESCRDLPYMHIIAYLWPLLESLKCGQEIYSITGACA